MSAFCPKCGSEEEPFIQGFCRKCYLEDHELIFAPESLEIERCAKCGKIRIFGRWIEHSPKALSEFFAKKIKLKGIDCPEMKIDLNQKSQGETEAVLLVQGSISGQKIEIEKVLPVKFKNVGCVFCGKLSAGYFEAKIQLRHSGERDEGKERKVYFDIKRALQEQQPEDSLSVITKHELLPHGQDICIGSAKAARTALARVRKKYPFNVISSKKLIGQSKSGKRRFQFTFSLRL